MTDGAFGVRPPAFQWSDPQQEEQALRDYASNTVVDRGGLLPLAETLDGKVGLGWPQAFRGDLLPGYMFGGARQAVEQGGNALTQAAQDMAGYTIGQGVASLFIPRPANSLGIFGGRLAKTADHAALAKAEQMDASGVPREQIWNDTGWFKGVDGNWRFEIDDSALGMTVRSRGTGRMDNVSSRLGMGGIVEHGPLVESYPDLASLIVRTTNKENRNFFSPDTPRYWDGDSWQRAPGSGQMQIGEDIYRLTWSGKKLLDVDEPLPHNLGQDSLKSVAAHELQHAAQNQEGWFRDIDPATSGRSGNYYLYRRRGDEAEARAVQSRLPLTPEQRRARFPWLDYDVPEADQIVNRK